jgi:hypothetical protein
VFWKEHRYLLLIAWYICFCRALFACGKCVCKCQKKVIFLVDQTVIIFIKKNWLHFLWKMENNINFQKINSYLAATVIHFWDYNSKLLWFQNVKTLSGELVTENRHGFRKLISRVSMFSQLCHKSIYANIGYLILCIFMTIHYTE